MCLAHTVGSAVENAYRRTDLFNRRRALMTDWESWCAEVQPEPSDDEDVDDDVLAGDNPPTEETVGRSGAEKRASPPFGASPVTTPGGR